MSRLHRFYVGHEQQLNHDFWLHNEQLLHQWVRVLRFKSGQEVVLFSDTHERLYTITEINPSEAHLVYVTDMARKVPAADLYLLWSLLKKDKNDWILQKGTELGVSHFIPLLADRSEKTGFNIERSEKIVIEAAEQCGRGDIPRVREPLNVQTAIDELAGKVRLYVTEQSAEDTAEPNGQSEPLGVLVGPEGGWSDNERQIFRARNINHVNLHVFTLRAETAAIAAVTKLLQ